MEAMREKSAGADAGAAMRLLAEAFLPDHPPPPAGASGAARVPAHLQPTCSDLGWKAATCGVHSSLPTPGGSTLTRVFTSSCGADGQLDPETSLRITESPCGVYAKYAEVVKTRHR